MTHKTWFLVLALGAWAAAGCGSSSSSSRGGSDPSLESLVVSADGTVAMFPAFDPDVHVYDVVLSAEAQNATVTATPLDASVRAVSITRLGEDVATSAPAGTATAFAVPEQGDAATLRVVATAPDAVASTGYTLRVTRRAAVGTDSTLASLTDAKGLLQFVPGTLDYADVYGPAQAAGYAITPVATDPLASVKVNGGVAAYGTSVPVALATGSNTISIVVTSQDGASQTTYTLRLDVTDATNVPVSGMTLSAGQVRLDTVSSKSATLVPRITPTAAADRGVSWVSSSPAVVTVDSTGKLTAVAEGHATVTATSHDGGYTATCEVYVFTPWFQDDFEGGDATHMDSWDLVAAPGSSGANGTFSVGTDGTNALFYTAGSTGGVLGTVKDAKWTAVPSGDYYVEARIKPLANSASNKLVYLVARYQDARNWYAAGLNAQTSSSSTKVEIATMKSGVLTRAKQFPKPFSLNVWHTVRFEVVGSTLSVYLNGELIGSLTDTSFTTGKVGLYSDNRSFEIDDVRVGSANDRPVQFTISPTGDYTAEAGDAVRTITVSAKKPDYATGTYAADAFTVSSSNITAVAPSIAGTSVTLDPVSAGAAAVTFRSVSNPSLTRVVNATIAPKFIQPTATYGDLGTRTNPAAGDTSAYPDTRLSITFDSPPVLGTTGSIRIFRKSDDALIDVIKPAAEVQTLGYAGQSSSVRQVNVEGLVTVSGNTVTIRPHDYMVRSAVTPKLAYGTEYYVAIGKGVITGTALNGTAFVGVGKAANWSFTTRAAAPTSTTSVAVAQVGTAADFRTVQGALDYAMQYAPGTSTFTIQVADGIYDELLYLRGKNNVTIQGASRDGTVVQFKNYDSLNVGSGNSQAVGGGTPAGGRAVFLVETSDLLELDTLTLKNTMARSPAYSSQAETIYFNNDAGRLIAKHARFVSEQDTLQLKGWSWFYDCLVEGNVDFIWGYSKAALFEDSVIKSLGDSTSTTSGGYLVQARVGAAADKGFVFLNSTLTHGAGPSGNDVPAGATYLARSGGDATRWDNVAYVNCRMDNHVIPVGWAYNVNGQPIPNPANATAASGWREYGTMDMSGNLVGLGARVGGYTLTDAEYAAGFSTRAQVFSAYGTGGWNPTP